MGAYDSNDYDPLPPSEFGKTEFALSNQPNFDRYIEYRLQGVGYIIAFRKSFPAMYCTDLSRMHQYADQVEYNLYTIRELRKSIEEIEPSKLWNAKIAMHEMLCIIRDPASQSSARLRAIEGVNILSGITFIDDKGKTRKGASLRDFYDDIASDSETDDAKKAANESEDRSTVDDAQIH
jgi:hypothetical protein